MLPIVGVIPLWDDEKESIWMLPGYMDGLRQAGGLPIMLPLTTDEREIVKTQWGQAPETANKIFVKIL